MSEFPMLHPKPARKAVPCHECCGRGWVAESIETYATICPRCGGTKVES